MAAVGGAGVVGLQLIVARDRGLDLAHVLGGEPLVEPAADDLIGLARLGRQKLAGKARGRAGLGGDRRGRRRARLAVGAAVGAWAG